MKRTAFPLSYFLFLFAYSLFTSCTTTAQISKRADKLLIADTAISKGFIGISIFDPASNTYLYNYNADKYFVPASNTKLFTLYAGMKYLGDSLVGLRYSKQKQLTDTFVDIYSTGDPTFLQPDFTYQPVFNFLKGQHTILINKDNAIPSLGNGWAWDDFNEDFMARKSGFTLYGNVIRAKWINKDSISIIPSYFEKSSYKFGNFDSGFLAFKEFEANKFNFLPGDDKSKMIPYSPDLFTFIDLLEDTLKNNEIYYANETVREKIKGLHVIHSQPSDSLFKPMMHRSDNFFAEQTLLMASNEHLGYMNDEIIIDTLLKTDLKDAPQKPKWVDGSGLSRYNLFTPQDFIYILNKMKNEFGMERMKTILATGGEGTLKNYFQKDAGFIYAKTGTLSNNCALSGYVITKKNRLLIFSVLANNYQTGATPVRRAVEKFILSLRENN